VSNAAAQAFIDRVIVDEALQTEMNAATSESQVAAILHREGFECSPAEAREAMLERCGEYLNEEQLAAVAGGLTPDQTTGVMVGAIAAGMAITITASAAAAAA
jgi:predicted ribosomally synthesized peptide with nif11-like leader